MSEQNGYEESIGEIESIIEALEKGELKVDDLAEKVKRALSLIKNCQDKLRSIEEDISGMQEEGSQPG